MQINETRITEIKTDSLELIRETPICPVTSDSEYDSESADLIEIKKALDFIEKERKTMMDPLNEVRTILTAKFKAMSDPLKEHGKAKKDELIKFATKRNAEAEEQAQKLRDEQAKIDKIEQEKIDKAEAEKQKLLAKAQAETDEKKKIALDKKIEAQEAMQAEAQGVMANNEAEPVEDPNKISRVGSGSSSIRKEKEIVIVDFEKLPDKYKLPNTVMINKDGKAGVEIPGTEVREKLNIAVRT